MFIQTEETPNPATLKFLPGRVVMESGTADFRSGEDVTHAPLAERLFEVAGVEGVFFGADFVTVSKNDDRDWTAMKPAVLGVLMQHFSSGAPAVTERNDTDQSAPAEDDDELTAQIRELIDTRVRPAVAQDGGDIVFHRFDDGIVYLQMRGACAGCPSSTATLKMGIENMLRHYVPEVRSVAAVGM